MKIYFRNSTRILAACLSSLLISGTAGAADALSVMSFGGAYQNAQREAYFNTYSKEKNVQIDEQEYGGEIARIKAMVESGNTTIDVVDVDAATLLQGCDEGIFESIDRSVLGDASDWIGDISSKCGVGSVVYATVLAYDADKVQGNPDSIKALFDVETYPGKRALWKNPMTNLEFALLADGVAREEVYATLSTPEGMQRAFAKLDTIKEHVVWWETGAQSMQLLASGEAVMATSYNGRIFDANREGRNFVTIWDGAVLDFEYWTIPKGTPKYDSALDFIRYTIQPEVLAAITNHIPYGPMRKSAIEFVAKDKVDALPTNPKNMETALSLDNVFWADNGDEIRRAFTTWLAQ